MLLVFGTKNLSAVDREVTFWDDNLQVIYLSVQLSGIKMDLFSIFIIFLILGSPTLVSWPHFYQADPKYREAVVGMKPDADKHAMFIDIAPVS